MSKLTAKQFFKAYRDICLHSSGCAQCMLNEKCHKARPYDDEDYSSQLLELVEGWVNEHPEAVLDNVGDGIYFDPDNEIIAQETVIVATIEVTVTGRKEYDADELKAIGASIANELNDFPIVQNAQCVGTQQLITRCYERPREDAEAEVEDDD